jgi:hypothetical protein
MYKYTENLDGYEILENTKSCYLDGRYFQKVFVRYPGLLSNPLNIVIRENNLRNPNRIASSERYYIHMKESNINTSVPGLLRLVITTPTSRHSNLLILDYTNQRVYRFEPLGVNAPYYEKVNDLIEDYLGAFFNFKLEVIDVEFDEIMDEKNPNCKKSGFCVAYIILYAYDFLNARSEFDPSNIRKFASMVENTYGSLPSDGAEIEYGLFTGNQTNTGQNMLIGGLGGAAIGGLAGGAGGALIGGLGGAALGGLI